MIEKPDTFRALIDRFGGVLSFAGKTGLGEHAVKKMRDRNSIAVEHWPVVIEASRDVGLILTSDDLLRMKVRNREAAA